MDPKKQEILEKLQNTYARLKASPIEGVGVFAIRDIPAGVNPFNTPKQEWYLFTMEELKYLDPEVLKMIDDFNVIEADQTVYVPERALNGMDTSFYLNNSDTPNLETIDGGETFRTLREIKKGEELTAAYATYDYKYEKK